MKTKFTKQQIENWRDYEDVRVSGDFNMYDPNARLVSGLTHDEYQFVMRNYSELKEAATNSKQA